MSIIPFDLLTNSVTNLLTTTDSCFSTIFTAAGLLDRSVILETLTSFKRAGCSGILTYFAPMVSKILNEDK